MNQVIENNQVQNVVQFKTAYRQAVQKIVHARETAGITQQFVAEWLGIDRRKISSFENLKKIDLETLLIYGHKMSVDIKLTVESN